MTTTTTTTTTTDDSNNNNNAPNQEVQIFKTNNKMNQHCARPSEGTRTVTRVTTMTTVTTVLPKKTMH